MFLLLVVLPDRLCSAVVLVLAMHPIRLFPLHSPMVCLRVPLHFNCTVPTRQSRTLRNF